MLQNPCQWPLSNHVSKFDAGCGHLICAHNKSTGSEYPMQRVFALIASFYFYGERMRKKCLFDLIDNIVSVGRMQVLHVALNSYAKQSTRTNGQPKCIAYCTCTIAFHFDLNFFSLVLCRCTIANCLMSRAAVTRWNQHRQILVEPNGYARCSSFPRWCRCYCYCVKCKKRKHKYTNLCTISRQPIRVESILLFEIAFKSVSNILYTAAITKYTEQRKWESEREKERERGMQIFVLNC